MIDFLARVARIQIGQGGNPVTTDDIRREYLSYSRTTVHKKIKWAVEAGHLSRVKRGQYIIDPTSTGLIAIGLCVLLPMDVYEYQSKKALYNAQVAQGVN